MPNLRWNGKPDLESLRKGPLDPFEWDGRSLVKEALIAPMGNGFLDAPANRLILGDNLDVMRALLPDYEGRIDLIYADPPFFTNRRFQARIGRGEDSRRPDTWSIVEGYHDVWEDLDQYLTFLYERLALMHRLLSADGTLYLHLDWHADAYARLILDELFGPENLLNEIIWAYHGPSAIRRAFNRKHDVILAYVKGKGYKFNVNAVRIPYNPSTIKTFASSTRAGFGKVPDLERGKVPEDWWYFPVVARLHGERSGYPTQKPEALLERIVLASSNPGDLVADFFCGSGTTAVVAAKHNRRFLACDANLQGIHTTRSRLVSLPSAPFSLEREDGTPWGTRETESTEFGLLLGEDCVWILPREDLIYWEVDPDWDGQVFKSLVQAARPLRDGDIAANLPLGKRKAGHKSVCVRLVMAGGEQFQVVLDK